MKIISTFHPSSSVLSSVKCRLSSRDLEHLVVAKLNELDVYSVQAHGLQLECSLNIWGKVCSVKSIPISKFEARSNIALMLTHPQPEFIILEYQESSSGSPELIVKKHLSLFERMPRIAEFFTDFLIHPSGNIAVVSCYSAKLKVISLKAGNFLQEFDVSLREINVLSICFLPTAVDQYTLAILYVDSQNRLQLCSRDIDVENLELSQQPSTLLLPTMIPDRVIPNPTEARLGLIPIQPDISESDSAFAGGILVVGGKEVLLFELASLESQAKQRGKQKRLAAKLNSSDATEVAQARAKEHQRGFRTRRANFGLAWPWNDVAAWCVVDEASSRLLIADVFGRLSMLSAHKVDELGLILIPLGEVSSPTTLAPLTGQCFYVGSHLGDSQLIQISPTTVSMEMPPTLNVPSDIQTVSTGTLSNLANPRKGKGKASSQNDMEVDEDEAASPTKGRIIKHQGTYINVLETYQNIAPIMDAICVDIDGSGQSQIVTCSGGANTGSINIVRNGADYKESAFIQGLTDVTQVWTVRRTFDDSIDTHLLVSTVNGSHLFRINDNGSSVSLLREDSGPPSDIVANQPTIAFSNFRKREKNVYGNSSLVVQVVPNGAHLLEWDAGLKVYQECSVWRENISMMSSNSKVPEIVAASINATQVALALSGGIIVLLCIEDGVNGFHVLRKHDTKREISAISFMPLDSEKDFSTVLSVAYWGSNSAEMFMISGDVLTMKAKSPRFPAVVRSLLLYNFGSGVRSKDPNHHAYLLAGLGDGSIATMSWKENNLRDLKITSLGNTPVGVTPYEVNGRRSVIAIGNRANVFFCESNRLANSPIILKDVSAACKLNTKTFTSSLVLVTPTGLSIGSVKTLNKMHIRSQFFGLDNPRKIVHAPLLKAFGVVSCRVEPTRITRYETSQSSFHLIDDGSLVSLGKFTTESKETIISLIGFSTLVHNQETPFFCLGTVVIDDEEREPTSGRLLIFTSHASNSATKTYVLEPILITSTEVKGAVYALKTVNNKIVATVNSSVLLYDFVVSSEGTQPPSYSLRKLADWNHNYLVTSLGSFNDRVIAGDQISSVSLLKVLENELSLEGKDYTPLYPVTVEALDTTSVIAANDTLNIILFNLTRNLRGESLEQVGYFYLGEMVSKFIRGSLTTPDRTKASKLESELIYFTSSGRIGVISNVKDKDFALHLTELQRNLAAVVPGVGGTSHARFRSPKNNFGPSDADQAAYGFIDGDFLEQFNHIQGSAELTGKVITGGSEPERLKLSEQDIVSFLEELQGLH